ncbi:HEAT repeat domain-containing protein [Clostridium saccharobutylicum]|nr:HEAT repeat domain-containing protein [Clostridium saccharobutylicum]NOW26640.1 HEAT repeat protein [Clostridium saccharobutylicum]
MNESNIEYLINELKNEKDKYTQEIIANRIGQFKSEYTANLVGKMLEIEDTRIRNTAIEILQDMGEMCINTISKMVYHNDKNVRKFILDIIKEIKTEKSSLVALAALNDNDDNIVQTAVEIVNYNRYIPAIPKLLDILKVTNNIWIIVALINAFSTLGEKSAAQHIEERLDEISLSTLEKNIIINYYVKALGDIGSIRHLEKTMTIYKNMFQIDDDNLDYCINGIVTRNEVDTLSLDVISLIQEYYEDKINSKNPKLTLDNIRTAVKLGFIFSIDSIELLKELLINSPSEDYFEGLFEIVANQKDLSKDIISELIKHNDSQINVFTLRLIRRRRILGFNEFVKSFLISGIDTNMCVEALNVVTRIESYYDKEILNRFVNCNNHELSKIAIQGIKLESVSDRDTLMKIFIGSNTDLRKIIVKRFIENSKFIDIDKIIEIIREAKDSAIVEALEILFYIDSKRAGEVIDETLDNEDKEIRKK